jgi:WW domain-containing oxidoreductase
VECGPSLDLTSQDSVKAFAAAIAKRPGQLNILVNNAGLGYTKKAFTAQNVGMLTQVWVGGWRTCGRSCSADLRVC